jgi:taurine dehydrogenase small subunit
MATTAESRVDVAFLESFAEAFNRHDLDGIMAHMTEDCVFYRSSGSDVRGTEYVGRAAVRAAFEDVMRLIRGVRFDPIRHAVFGDRGISEWIMSGTLVDGSRTEVRGLDLFEFRAGKIAVKDSYLKRRT